MKPYRCLICGETYLGAGPTDRCPYCGVAGKYLVAAAEWTGYPGLAISAEDRALCEQALGFEVENIGFYQACTKKAETQIAEAIFKRLAKQELEHAEIFAKLMQVEMPQTPKQEVPEDDEGKFAKAHLHEHRAIKFYLDANYRATNQRVKEVFRAISDAEAEHLIISNVYR